MSAAKEAQKPVVVSYKGAKYDVTAFLQYHPAGRTIIEKRAGQDITEAFDKVGHTDMAHSLMAKYKQGADGKRATGLAPSRQTAAYMAKILSRKLFTHEDKMYVHKILGFFSLLSYLYRYLYHLPKHGSLGFEQASAFNLLSLALHMLLSVSSLIFHVLEKRIIKNPLVIYEEYRLHAIAFTARALGVSAIGMCIHLIEGETTRRLVLVAFMVFVHQIVDLITRWYGTAGITAVRNKDATEFKALKMFFSYYQFIAIASHLILDDHLCDLGFNAVIAIQSSAFLMTLKRKGLVRWKTYAFWYGLALVLSSLYMLVAKGPMFFIAVGVVFYTRITYNINKYVLWAGYVVAVYGCSAAFPQMGKLYM